MKSGFVTIIGRPNVGKSTLLNKIVGEKLAITSNKPQTTRNSIQGIYNAPEGQVVLVDTPGIHAPAHKLGEKMMEAVNETLSDMDVVIVVVEPGRPHEGDAAAIAKVKTARAKKILVINKTDMVETEKVAECAVFYANQNLFDEIVPISAYNGTNVDELLKVIFQMLPEGPGYFPEDELTDQPERFLMAEYIREKALYVLDKEIPHGIAVVVDRMTEREDKRIVDIEATIYCEKASHKPIILGRQGRTIKEIGSQARVEMQHFLGCRVNLQLWVKVKENWRDSEIFLANLDRDNYLSH